MPELDPFVLRGMSIAHRTVGPLVARRLRAEVTGAGHLPSAGPAIIAANHQSYLDNYLVSSVAPRPPWFLGKAELAKGLFGKFNHAMGMIPIERGKGDRAAIDTMVDILAAGEVIALFPEGTRSLTGELHKFRSGLARIAAMSKAPVVPVGLLGTSEVWPSGERPRWRRPARGTIEVRFGPVLPPPEDTPKSRREFSIAARERVADLTGQALAAGYAPLEALPEADGPPLIPVA